MVDFGETKMRWEKVCEDKQLQNLPFKIELNKWGQIVMSPVKIKHSFYQGRIIRLLESLLNEGEIMPECAINTSDGVKVADVVWCSEERFKKIEDEISASIAPEICVEVKSTGNTCEEMQLKNYISQFKQLKYGYVMKKGKLLFIIIKVNYKNLY